jgi:hypothetical protein
MKNTLPSVLFIFLAVGLHAQELRTIENNAFQQGEYLKYRVFYDSWLTTGITAGTITLKVSDETRMMNGREIYHIWATGKSTGMFTLFYKVRDRFETYLDKEAIIPWRFIRHTREGGYKVNEDVYFNHPNHYAKSSGKTIPIPQYVQDFVSGFYYLRTFDFDTVEVNDEYQIDFYLDDSVYVSRIIFLGRERVQTVLGVFDCLKFKPKVAKGEVFIEPYPMTLWISDDDNKIPILGKSAVYVGNVMFELVSHKGLKHPLERAKKND